MGDLFCFSISFARSEHSLRQAHIKRFSHKKVSFK